MLLQRGLPVLSAIPEGAEASVALCAQGAAVGSGPSVFRSARPFCCFHEEVLATDASEWGLGVVSSQRLAADVRFACKFSERWRFKHGQGPAREGMGELDTPEDATRASFTDLPTGHVPPVGAALVEGEWSVLCSRKWERVEGMPVLEGRALVWGVRHVLRNSKTHGRNFLLLSDAMAPILAISEGRSSAKGMMRVCRRVAALALACNASLHLRWIASERNPADSPSRRGLRHGDRAGEAAEGEKVALRAIVASAKRPADASWQQLQSRDRLVVPRTTSAPAESRLAQRREVKRPLTEVESPADTEVIRLEWPSDLQRHSVTAKTRGLYLDARMEFEAWINSASRPTSASITAGELDQMLARFIDVLYCRGKHVSHGERLLSAVCFLHPRLGRQHGRWLCGSRQALRGWSRLIPKRSRLPLPWEVVCLIVNWLVTRGFW